MKKQVDLIQIFKLLLDHYGPQNWWPGEGLEIAIGAVLTQQTSWNNVERALNNLRKADCLSLECLLSLKIDELAELIRPSGYYRLKAERLKNLLLLLSKNPTPTREELLAVKGIGKETADSILLYQFEKPFFVIDAYTYRLFYRLGLYTKSKYEYEDLKSFIVSHLPIEVELYKEYHALIVIHAKETCKKKNPQCYTCPLSTLCKKIIH